MSSDAVEGGGGRVTHHSRRIATRNERHGTYIPAWGSSRMDDGRTRKSRTRLWACNWTESFP